MAVTLINSFKVPLDQEEAFLSGWKKTSAALVSKVEFLEARAESCTMRPPSEPLPTWSEVLPA
jgi:hypothetical protein